MKYFPKNPLAPVIKNFFLLSFLDSGEIFFMIALISFFKKIFQNSFDYLEFW